MYLLDTNTLIYFFKGNLGVAESLFSQVPGSVAIPAVVIYELQYGIARSSSPRKRMQQLAKLTDAIQVIPFGVEEAAAAAKVRFQTEKRGAPIGPHDVMIAGTAIAHRAVLVTNNEREFRRVGGLKMENWYR